jgi:hypothetical protein
MPELEIILWFYVSFRFGKAGPDAQKMKEYAGGDLENKIAFLLT